jgi:antitoxin MazE
MKGSICKWGNSYAIRIPKSLLDDFELKENSVIYLEKQKNGIILIPQKSEETLAELVAKITPENKPSFEDVDWGEPVGKEFW